MGPFTGIYFQHWTGIFRDIIVYIMGGGRVRKKKRRNGRRIMGTVEREKAKGG